MDWQRLSGGQGLLLFADLGVVAGRVVEWGNCRVMEHMLSIEQKGGLVWEQGGRNGNRVVK